MILESVLYKQKVFYLFLIKLQTDAVTSSSVFDFLSFDKVTTTGLLLIAIWYFFKENKRIEQKYAKTIEDKEAQIERLLHDKEELLKNASNKA